MSASRMVVEVSVSTTDTSISRRGEILAPQGMSDGDAFMEGARRISTEIRDMMTLIPTGNGEPE